MAKRTFFSPDLRQQIKTFSKVGETGLARRFVKMIRDSVAVTRIGRRARRRFGV